jgi:hypothetical protein
VNETALVTGASSGIGEDLARLLAASGRHLVLAARSANKLQALADDLAKAHSITASVLPIDLSEAGSAESVARTLADRGLTIDILINNAGFGAFGEFARSNPDEQRQMLNLNVVALTMLTRALLPGMIERRRGRILNVASTAAFQPGPLMAVYYASKAYVLSFSEALSEEARGTGVTVTCLCPGPTRTGFQDRADIQRTRLLEVSSMLSSADVARAGYEAMMAGRPLIVPGWMNKIGVHAMRLTPRTLAPKIIRALHAER